MSEPKKLTDREQQFVIEYLVDFNAAKAGLRAGFTNKKPIGWRVKRRKAVAAAIHSWSVSLAVVRSMNIVASPLACCHSSATAIARLVFPIPPEPTTLTAR